MAVMLLFLHREKILTAMRKITAIILLAAGAMAALQSCAVNRQEAGNQKDSNMEQLTLTTEWDKTFPQSDKVVHSKVTFVNRYGITLAADMYVPENAEGRLPAIAVSGPFGAVKEQCSGLYAQTLAEMGFLTITFDPSFTGESGGQPRYVASPDFNTEDFSAAVDFLSTNEMVDPERIGILGICGWGGFAVNAAAVDTRIKATVASTMYDISRNTANNYFDADDNADARHAMRQALNAQRTEDYRNGSYALAGGVVDPLPEDAPQFVKDYYAYYKTPRGYHKRSLNSNGGWNRTSALSFLNMPILSYAGEIRSAVLLVHGENAHSRYFSEDTYKKLKGDNKRLMTDVPRGEWGFAGAIMTDWGAMNDRVEAVKAGLDLEMPGPCSGNDARIVQAVRDGALSEEQVDVCAARMVELALRVAENAADAYDREAHNELARQIARESAVLLRKGSALPLKAGARLAVIGDFAKNPRYQGAGSSKINPTVITSLCDALDKRNIAYSYAQGFVAEGQPDDALVTEAVETAKGADVAVVMLGLPDSFESEGFDRAHMNLPENQNLLMAALVKTGTPVVAVLSTGSAVILPWREQADSILLLYLGGQNVGSAAADLSLLASPDSVIPLYFGAYRNASHKKRECERP